MENTQEQKRFAVGLPFLALVGLALLNAPRMVLHDMHILEEGSFVNALFALVPLLVWILVVVLARVPNPFLTLLVVGALYGVVLLVGHQLLWDVNFPDGPPQLGGSESAMRGIVAVSSLVTGVMVGAVTGLVAWGVSKLVRRHGRQAR